MSNPGEADGTPIRSVRQLAEHIAEGCKPRSAWRIGTEHEKFGFRRDDFTPPPYAPAGIRAVLDGLHADGSGWEPITDEGAIIGLSHGPASIALEPGGQLELSGGTLETLHETRDELAAHFAAVREVARPLGLGFSPLGFHPTARREDMPWMPKSRYAIMRRYMPQVGTRGLDMMLRTCTVQVNLDYGSEADMVRKLRVGLLLQPVATALFANSPFTEGRPNGFMSYRAEIWRDTDNARAGIPACVFEPGFGFERYVEWLLDVPMYFVLRDGQYVDMAGRSFRDHMQGRAGGGAATVGDFADHMTTAFTDVRLKRFLEMRGADAGSPAMMLAQSALWVGLLYDDAALAAAEGLLRAAPWQEFAALRDRVPREGLAVTWRGGTLRDLAREMVAIAAEGLRARGLRDAAGVDESAHLAPLQEIADGAPIPAESWLQRFSRHHNGGINALLTQSNVT